MPPDCSCIAARSAPGCFNNWYALCSSLNLASASALLAPWCRSGCHFFANSLNLSLRLSGFAFERSRPSVRKADALQRPRRSACMACVE